jgi:hypothetical protein
MSIPICMYCETYITGAVHKDYAYAPIEIRYYCADCAEGEK